MNKTSSILPLMLILAGVLEAIFPFIILFNTIPQVIHTYNESSISYNPLGLYGPTVVVLIVILSQLVYGVRLQLKQKINVELDPQSKKIAIILLVCGGFATLIGLGFGIVSVIAPLYSSLGSKN